MLSVWSSAWSCPSTGRAARSSVLLAARRLSPWEPSRTNCTLPWGIGLEVGWPPQRGLNSPSLRTFCWYVVLYSLFKFTVTRQDKLGYHPFSTDEESEIYGD